MTVFLGVDWGAFVVVFVVALAATAVIVTFFALGIRLFAAGATEAVAAGPVSAEAGGGAGRAGGTDRLPAAPAAPRSLPATVGGAACFAVGIAAVLAGLWLIVPQFH